MITGALDVGPILEMSEALTRGIAGAQKVILPGVAHHLNLEAPETFNQQVLAFLQALDEDRPEPERSASEG